MSIFWLNHLLYFNVLENRVLAQWAQSVVNHLYWSIATCDGDGKALVERFTSLIHHTCNRHSFPMNTIYKECEHEKLSEEAKRKKQWLVMGSSAHDQLRKIIAQDGFVKDLEKVCDQISTTLLEVFHSVKIRYLPKSIFYGYEKMIAGTQLAALDHNNNVGRDQVKNSFFHTKLSN